MGLHWFNGRKGDGLSCFDGEPSTVERAENLTPFHVPSGEAGFRVCTTVIKRKKLVFGASNSNVAPLDIEVGAFGF